MNMKARVIEQLENPFSTGEDFSSLLDQYVLQMPEEGKVVAGKVVAIEKENVVVDIGFKSEGRIPLKDFPLAEQEDLAVGDTVEVYVERIENHKYELVLSRERAVSEEVWESLEGFYEKNEPVQGVIFSRIKGGFLVDIQGVSAFLPGRQVDVRPVRDITPLMGITQPFILLKMDRKRGNIVVSRRAVLEETRSAEREEALSDIQEGMVLEGTVKNITDYGAFVDLGAVDGLLHVTDISWKRISHPTEVLSVAQTIRVKVIHFDKEKQRISLGMKQLTESPWEKAQSLYAVGTRHKGHVTNVTDYGAFVELEDGIEGLVHVSEMSWTKKNVYPGKIVAVGEEVEVEVLSIEPEKHRLSLGMKQCSDNPWQSFASQHKVGDVLECEVQSVADFGLFVGFGGMVDGLVHLSELTWEDNAEAVLKSYQKGDKVTVKILDIDPEKERLSFGIKQLNKDPMEESLGQFKRGQVATCKVVEVNDNGIEVELGEGVRSFIRRGDLSNDKVECRPERFSVGDRVDAKITSIDKKSRAVKLSIKALEQEHEKQAIEAYGSTDSGAALGNILGVALDSVRAQQEEAGEKKPETKAKAKIAAEASDADDA